MEEQRNLEKKLSPEDFDFLDRLLKIQGYQDARRKELIQQYSNIFLAPGVMEKIRKNSTPIYEIIAPDGAFHEI